MDWKELFKEATNVGFMVKYMFRESLPLAKKAFAGSAKDKVIRARCHRVAARWPPRTLISVRACLTMRTLCAPHYAVSVQEDAQGRRAAGDDDLARRGHARRVRHRRHLRPREGEMPAEIFAEIAAEMCAERCARLLSRETPSAPLLL